MPGRAENPFGGLTKIDGFVIRGATGTAAQTYAVDNEFTFETGACTAHQPVTETVAPDLLHRRLHAHGLRRLRRRDRVGKYRPHRA